MKVAEDFFIMEVAIKCKSEMMSYNYNPSRDGRRSEPSPRWQPAEKVLRAGVESAGDDNLARRSNRWKCEFPYIRAGLLRESLIERTKWF